MPGRPCSALRPSILLTVSGNSFLVVESLSSTELPYELVRDKSSLLLISGCKHFVSSRPALDLESGEPFVEFDIDLSETSPDALSKTCLELSVSKVMRHLSSNC